MMDSLYHDRIERIKSISNVPLVLFPGAINQINRHFDAMLFMSLLSGRNPHYLIGEQVLAAPIVKDIGVETIPTGYVLIDGGSSTTVEFVSGTRPLPPSRIDLIISHALAAQFLGMDILYLEAGSGAKKRVPNEVVEMVAKESQLDIIVGGGIKSPNDASELAQAGASFVVVGSAIEKSIESMNDFAAAIHD
jgi:phosphoglycerol geranylgeranyltransferase